MGAYWIVRTPPCGDDQENSVDELCSESQCVIGGTKRYRSRLSATTPALMDGVLVIHLREAKRKLLLAQMLR